MERQFTEDSIREIYDILTEKVTKGGGLSVLERKMGPAAGHALDALEMTRDLDCPLALDALSEEAVNAAVLAVYGYYEKNEAPAAVCRDLTAKKIGSYLLFAVCNACNRDGRNAAPVTKGSDLLIEVLAEKEEPEGSGSGAAEAPASKPEGSGPAEAAAEPEVIAQIEVLGPTERFVREELRYDGAAGAMALRDAGRLFRVIRSQAAWL